MSAPMGPSAERIPVSPAEPGNERTTAPGRPAWSAAEPGDQQRRATGQPRALPGVPGWVRFLAPGLIYALGQLLTVEIVLWVARIRDRTASEVLFSWDAQHFVDIARDGYTMSVAKGTNNSPAFFPGLPSLIRVVHWVTRLPYEASGYLIAVVSGLAFAYGLIRLVHHMRGCRPGTGLLLVGLVSVSPLSVVLSMIYTESLFCALAAWGLVFIVEKRWLTAGFVVAAAGLVRPTGSALAAALVVAVIVDFVGGGRSWRLVVSAALAVAGSIAWILIVAVRIGYLGAWFQAQTNGWGTKFDFGRAMVKYIGRALVYAPAFLDVAVVIAVVLSLVLAVLFVKGQRSLPLIAYTVLALVTNIGSDGVMNSKIRLMIPAFTLLVPLVIWIRRQHAGTRLMLILGYTAVGIWYSAYGLIIYGYAI